MRVAQFIDSLKKTPAGLFNPWFHQDKTHDALGEAPRIRREQLKQYLEERLEQAKTLLIAEALGYQGGHFSGIAMTSERILLGYHQQKQGIAAEDVFRGIQPRRTSRVELKEHGMNEPTATIVWSTIKRLRLNPYSIVLWNAVPWHPYRSESGMLSNRTPTRSELQKGLNHLHSFISLFGNVTIIAVGKKCEESLNGLGVDFSGVRHPANGGATRFREQMAALHTE